MNTSDQIKTLAISLLLSFANGTVLAQESASYPNKPVRIVVPTPAGGPSDTVARLLAQTLSSSLGQQVIVENKPGAGGAIAAQAVMSTPPDGYTLLWGLSSMAGLPFVQKSSAFKNMNELAPISNVVNFGYAMFVNNDVPASNFREWVAYGKANPQKLSYATGTLSEFMMGEQLLKAVGVKAVRVPYKGAAQLMPDLISGQVQVNFGPILSGLQYVRVSKLKVLATMLPQRFALLPNVPTVAELGISMGNIPTWNGLFAPHDIPREIVSRISGEIANALKNPALRVMLEQQGAVPVGSTPSQLAESVESASQAWRSFVRDYDIPLE